jgi:hypothetical protein
MLGEFRAKGSRQARGQEKLIGFDSAGGICKATQPGIPSISAW